ncbi:hypothetical protein ADK64_06515 [Streptomyces sp. MMG1121]|nr:hypothetical protein ADK64_06515 [Streptomyces sp. MMG1121]
MDAYHIAVTKKQQEQAKWRQWYEEQLQKSQQKDDDGSWVPGWLKDTANTIGDYGQAILGNSDIWAGLFETGAGMIGVGGGASIDVAGGGLCLTIIGCIEGAPVIVAGTGTAGAGIYGITDGIGRFSNGLGQALREARQEEAGGAEESCGQCFVAGTKVLMAGGSTKRIEDITEGDKVVATDRRNLMRLLEQDALWACRKTRWRRNAGAPRLRFASRSGCWPLLSAA